MLSNKSTEVNTEQCLLLYMSSYELFSMIANKRPKILFEQKEMFAYDNDDEIIEENSILENINVTTVMTGKAHKYDFVNAFTLKTKDLKSLLVDEKVDKTMIALQANKSSKVGGGGGVGSSSSSKQHK